MGAMSIDRPGGERPAADVISSTFALAAAPILRLGFDLP